MYAKQIEAPKPTSELCFDFDDKTGTITSYTTTYFDENGIEQTREECSSDVFIPDTIRGVEVTTIGENAFLQKGLTSVILPEKLQTVKAYAFLENQLTQVVFHEGLTTIEDGAFYDNQLSSIDIPNSVTTIGSQVFFNNPSLDEIAVGKSVIESSTAWSSGIVNKEISHITVKEGTTYIPTNSFLNLGLTSISLPDSLITIHNDAFKGNKLKEIIIPNQVTTIGDSAFNGNQLENVVLGESLTEIGYYMPLLVIN